MKLLLTSSGISNQSIRNALIELLGKPIEQSSALFIPTAIYPFPDSPYNAFDAVSGKKSSSVLNLGWKALGLLELTILPNIKQQNWLPSVMDADALLIWGGDPVFLTYWFHKSGLAQLLPEILEKTVYVGVSAGSICTASTFGEIYDEKMSNEYSSNFLSEQIQFSVQNKPLNRAFLKGPGLGFVDFAVIPHYNNPNHIAATFYNADIWASKLPLPVYAIDDQTAIKSDGEKIEIISEGQWKKF